MSKDFHGVGIGPLSKILSDNASKLVLNFYKLNSKLSKYGLCMFFFVQKTNFYDPQVDTYSLKVHMVLCIRQYRQGMYTKVTPTKSVVVWLPPKVLLCKSILVSWRWIVKTRLNMLIRPREHINQTLLVLRLRTCVDLCSSYIVLSC